MKVLVACEESQEVCKAFRELGYDAWSCDIQPPRGGHPEWHIQDDVLKHLDKEWDLIIAHPPCTDLAVSGARWFEEKRKDGRQQQSAEFFMEFVNAKCKHIAIENPIGIMSNLYRQPDQIIQPWQFGDPYPKATCLWLKDLPPLKPTVYEKPEMEYVEWTDSKTGRKKRQAKWYTDAWHLSSDERSRVRSQTFHGIAVAMAEQWGRYVESGDDLYNGGEQLTMFDDFLKEVEID